MSAAHKKRRVVITGLGIVSPVGSTVATAWKNILAGKSGITPITHFDVSNFPTRFAGIINDLDLDAYLSKKEARKMDPFIHYGMVAAMQAVEDAQLDINDHNAERVGVALGAGIGGLPGIEKGHTIYLKGGVKRISPFFVPSNIINMIAGNVSIKLGIKGPNYAIVTACATGTHNIGDAARLIEYGDADAMIAGGAEMASSPMGLGGFGAARALSTRNDNPQAASRPWDKDRDGFVLGDGAGVLVLEAYEHAKQRGANIYAELTGFGMSSDAYHMTLPSENGEGASRCINHALRNACLNPEQIDYINAHGTSTLAGDIAETQAIKTSFGSHAYKLAISSTKSMTGHLLGAAGGVEAIFSVLAIRDQVAPPTINLDHRDAECDLDYVPHHARTMPINHVLSNSFGFGGTNASLVFSKIEDAP